MKKTLHPEMAPQSDANSRTAVGAFLRASRLRRGEDLAEVASQLRIRNVYLEAIEDSRFEELPGNTYAVGFIRTYAEYLGLDGIRVVERYRDEITSDSAGQSLTFPTIIPENGIPRGAAVMVSLLVVAVGYGAWFFLNSTDHSQVTAVAPVPEQIERAAGGPPASSLVTLRAAEPSQPASAVAAPAEPGPAAPTSAAAETPAPIQADAPQPDPQPVAASPSSEPSEQAIVDKPAATPEPATITPEAEPAPDPVAPAAPEQLAALPGASDVRQRIEQASEPATDQEPAATPATDTATSEVNPEPVPVADAAPETQLGAATAPAPAAAQIVIRAVIDSWIQVRDIEANQLVMTMLLRSGDSYEVPARRGLSLLTGNAGALEIEVDGKLVPSIGPVGTVRHNVVLDAEKLSTGTAITQ
jgi:cytoskeleton protein RodZ